MATPKKNPKDYLPKGRPTEYDVSFCQKLPDMFKNGESVAEVCAKLGIWKDTFYNWVKEYPDFSDAYKKGLELSEAWWVELGRKGSEGKKRIQPATWIFNMKNRFKWTDRIDASITGDMTVGTTNITPEERKQRIAELLNKANEP